MKRALFAGALLTGLVFLMTPPASAQTGQVRGKVVGPEGKPVLDATVVLEFQGGIPRKYELKTNKQGEYLQVGLAPGPYRITASKEGFRPSVSDVRVQLGPTDVPDIELLSAETAPPGSEEAKLRSDFAAAAALTNEGKLDEAEAAFKVLAEKYPDITEIYQNLGVIYSQKKDWPAAEASYKKALELSPGDTGIASALAQVYQDSGQTEKATALMSEAVQANPQDATAQYNRGVFLLNSGDSAEAQAAFEAALAADPNKAEAHYQLATILVGQGKVDEAIQHLETYLSLNPTNAQNVATAKGLLQALKK
jgi:tetratricopeptide (TPR) repeat protein